MLSDGARRWAKFGVALAGSLVFSYLFLRSVNLGETWDALAAANYAYVAPALLLFAASVMARAVRWQVMYLPQREISLRLLVPALLIGYAGNNLLPLRAGELLRAQYLASGRRGIAPVPWMVTFGTFLMERLFDFIVLSTFVLWGVFVVHEGGAYRDLALLLGAGTLAGFIVATALARKPSLASLVLDRPWPGLSESRRADARGLVASFLEGFACLASVRRLILVALATAVAWGLELGMYFVIAHAFALHAGFVKVAFAGAAANVAMSVPSAQGGVGPFQYFAREALGKAGVTGSSAAAYALALHIFLVGPVSLVGLVVLWRSAIPAASAAGGSGAPAAAPGPDGGEPPLSPDVGNSPARP